MSTENPETVTGSVSRRTVIKTAAWAAPVVAVAVAAPLAAASTTGPQPVPSGANGVLDGGISVGSNRSSTPNEIRINQTTSGFGYFLYDSNGDEYPDGTYYADAPTITISWSGTGNYTPSVRDARNWVQVGSLTAGTSGSVIFTYPGQLLNGAVNRVPAPYIVLKPTTGTTLPPTTARVEATATNFDKIAGSITI